MDLPSDDNQSIICFTDGACSNNGKSRAKASYAIVFPHNRSFDKAECIPRHEQQTNNRGEYWACIHALQTATLIDPSCSKSLCIYTDSMLLINSMTTWIHKWKKNDWKTAQNQPVKNIDLIQQIDKLMIDRKNVKFVHVEAHTKKTDWQSYYNNIVDSLARNALNHCV